MVIYSRADNDLEFQLRRSIQIAKERKMEKGKGQSKKNGNKERASVSRERRLALALRAVLDAIQPLPIDDIEIRSGVDTAVESAATVLNDLNYGSLVGIPRRLKELNEELKAATDAGDGATIARIGAEMVKVKAGKDVTVKAQVATGGE